MELLSGVGSGAGKHQAQAVQSGGRSASGSRGDFLRSGVGAKLDSAEL